MKLSLTFLILILCCTACAKTPSPEGYLNQWNVHNYTSQGFDHCKGYGCRLIDHIKLDARSWRKIDRFFVPKSKTPVIERQRLAKVASAFEKIVAPITNTTNDVKGTFYKLGDDQLDCVDESINTTTLLLILRERGHILFHDVKAPTSRPPFLGGNRWPHQAATIKDRETNIHYVVDTWFENSGGTSYVLPVQQWVYGWSPRKIKGNSETTQKAFSE